MSINALLFATTLLAAGGIPLTGIANELDPQYLIALGEISEKRRVVGSDFHRWRDHIQWAAVRETISQPDLLTLDGSAIQFVLHERYDLVKAIERYPLWERIPGHAAISTRTLSLWQHSRINFLKLIRKSIRK